MIGIIGQGFVGNAVFQKFKNFYKVNTYDLNSSLAIQPTRKQFKMILFFYVYQPQ